MNINHFFVKRLTLVSLVIAISALHIIFSRDMKKSHVIAQELYFLPIILGAFWYGLRGGVITALAITVFYLTYTLVHWQGFSTNDLDRLLEILFFNTTAIIVGLLHDRQKAREQEKFAAVRAVAATVGHEINSPLFVAMGTLELLQDDLQQNSEAYRGISHVRKNLKQMKSLVKRISTIEHVGTRDYDGTSQIIDLENSTRSA